MQFLNERPLLAKVVTGDSQYGVMWMRDLFTQEWKEMEIAASEGDRKGLVTELADMMIIVMTHACLNPELSSDIQLNLLLEQRKIVAALCDMHQIEKAELQRNMEIKILINMLRNPVKYFSMQGNVLSLDDAKKQLRKVWAELKEQRPAYLQ